VGRLISAYQNPDGGLGHALEPDLRFPESQPLFVEVGLSALHEAGWRDEQLSLSICAFLESVSGSDGLVPFILPNALSSPHASHMISAGGPDLNPTAGICGLLHFQGIRHPWLERATQRCCQLFHLIRTCARVRGDPPALCPNTCLPLARPVYRSADRGSPG
jgi:hypothetical protein